MNQSTIFISSLVTRHGSITRPLPGTGYVNAVAFQFLLSPLHLPESKFVSKTRMGSY